jgi:hypothetical protein
VVTTAATVPRRCSGFPVIDQVDVPAAARARWLDPQPCPDVACHAQPHTPHHDRCEQAPCPLCGVRRVACGHHGPGASAWHGVDPEIRIAADLGWWLAYPVNGPVPDFAAVHAAVAGRHIVWHHLSQQYLLADEDPNRH